MYLYLSSLAGPVKKRAYFVNKSMAKFIKICVGKEGKSKWFKVLIFSHFSRHILINFLIRLNIYVLQFLQNFLKKDDFSPIS